MLVTQGYVESVVGTLKTERERLLGLVTKPATRAFIEAQPDDELVRASAALVCANHKSQPLTKTHFPLEVSTLFKYFARFFDLPSSEAAIYLCPGVEIRYLQQCFLKRIVREYDKMHRGSYENA